MDSSNSPIQVINSEKSVGIILSKFSREFIMDVIEDSLKMKFRPFNVGSANLVIAIEQNLKLALLQNPAYKDNIDSVRDNTYKEIISIICKYYNLSITDDASVYNTDQAFNLAYILYDTFITNFTTRMISFFVRYIMDNKEDIYNSIYNVDEIRKNKETVSYGKKMYTDPKLIVIHSDLNNVLGNIVAHDIPFNVLMSYLVDKDTANYLSNIIQDNGDIYKYHYASYIMDPITRPDVFTAIKFEMQNMASDKPIDFGQYAV